MRRRHLVGPDRSVSDASPTPTPSPLESLDRVLHRSRPPPIDVSREKRSHSAKDGTVSFSSIRLSKWVFLGAGLIMLSLLILIPLLIRRQRSKKEVVEPKANEQKAQFDRLLAAALEQEKEFKALKQQHALLIQQVKSDEYKRAQEAQRRQVEKRVPSTVVEETYADLGGLEMREQFSGVPEPLIFTTSMMGMAALSRPTSSAVVEDVTDEEELLDRELDSELKREELKEPEPESEEEHTEAPELALSDVDSLPPLAPALPLNINGAAAAPILVFDGDVSVKPLPKTATKRTPKPRKPKAAGS